MSERKPTFAERCREYGVYHAALDLFVGRVPLQIALDILRHARIGCVAPFTCRALWSESLTGRNWQWRPVK